MNVEYIETGYHPRPHQQILHSRLKRFNVLVCHRRFGKTVFALNEMIDRALRCKLQNPQYAYIAPTYGQAERVAWQYLQDFTKDLPGVKPNQQKLTIEIPRPETRDRLKFMLLSAEKPEALKGIYLDGVILDEYAECNPIIWTEVIRPALSDRKGWGIFIGTPKGQNHFHDIYKKASLAEHDNWFTALYRASETGIVDAEELAAAKLTMSEEEYEQEFECSFTAALIGAYYGKQIEEAEKVRRVGKVPYDPAVPVDTYWDLGIGDSTAIWFVQSVGNAFHIIDYLEDSGQGLDHYVRQLKREHRAKYEYREHILPHDAKARDLGTGKTRVETFRSLGLKKLYVLKKENVDDGIHAVRMVLPRCWFDAVNCERGLDALKNYQKKWDSKNKIFSTKPLHNWASHGADGFRTFAMGVTEEQMRPENRVLPRQAEMDYDILGEY